MRFTASSSNYDFDAEKVKIDENTLRRSIHVQHVDLKKEFMKIGRSYVLVIDFYGLDTTDRDNLNTIFLDDYGDLTAISAIDEVQSGETYDAYSGNMYISKPTDTLTFRRSAAKKQINNWHTKITVICDTKTTPTKP